MKPNWMTRKSVTFTVTTMNMTKFVKHDTSKPRRVRQGALLICSTDQMIELVPVAQRECEVRSIASTKKGKGDKIASDVSSVFGAFSRGAVQALY